MRRWGDGRAKVFDRNFSWPAFRLNWQPGQSVALSTILGAGISLRRNGPLGRSTTSAYINATFDMWVPLYSGRQFGAMRLRTLRRSDQLLAPQQPSTLQLFGSAEAEPLVRPIARGDQLVLAQARPREVWP